MSDHIFISYSRGDESYVRRLADYLAGVGVAVWFDHNLTVGDRFDRVIRQQISSCLAVVVVMTPSANESNWVWDEIAWAKSDQKPILPLLLAGTEPVDPLIQVSYDDVRGGILPSPTFRQRLHDLYRPGAAVGRSAVSTAVYPVAAPGPPRSTRGLWTAAVVSILLCLAVGAIAGAKTVPGPWAVISISAIGVVGLVCSYMWPAALFRAGLSSSGAVGAGLVIALVTGVFGFPVFGQGLLLIFLGFLAWRAGPRRAIAAQIRQIGGWPMLGLGFSILGPPVTFVILLANGVGLVTASVNLVLQAVASWLVGWAGVRWDRAAAGR